MSSMSRRGFLKISAATGATVYLGVAHNLPTAHAATTLTGVTYLPQSYEALSWGMNGFVERLQEAGGDAITVDYYDSAKLLKADEQLPALRSRAINFMFHTSSYITRSLPIMGITGLPTLVEDLYRHGDRIAIGSPLFDLINQQLAGDNLYMLSAGGGVLEPEYIWSTADAPVKSLADLDGKRVRIVSFEATEALAPFGVGAVRIPSSETYLALQRGTIDAMVANISTVIGRSIQEQTAFCYQLPVTGYTISIFMLKDAWDSLPDEVRDPLQTAATWYDQNFASHCNQTVYPEDYWPRVEQAGNELIAPSEEDLAAFRERSQPVWDSWSETVGSEIGQQAIELVQGSA